MEIVFPRAGKRHEHVDIAVAADDVIDLDVVAAWDYPMAFKFLSRCK